MPLILPEGYKTELSIYDTQQAIVLIKESFQNHLAKALSLKRVSAPLFVTESSGLNDNLNGTERAVKFDVPAANGIDCEVVHSLAKWKRMALGKYEFREGNGLYTDMNAIRRDEPELDNIHSVYVDQWDWEKVINKDQRNLSYLYDTVQAIVNAMADTEEDYCEAFHNRKPSIKRDVFFITSQELEDMYPELVPQMREYEIAKKYKSVFISQIGGALKSGQPHGNRAPDYDDWNLNGDIILWNDLLQREVELSSMGIRVDEESMRKQLSISGCEDRAKLLFHKNLLDGKLPLTIGGGIGQSRLCMMIMGCAHIGEVQSGVWTDDTRRICRESNIFLL